MSPVSAPLGSGLPVSEKRSRTKSTKVLSGKKKKPGSLNEDLEAEEDKENEGVNLDINVPAADEAETSWDTDSEIDAPDSDEDDEEERDHEEGNEAKRMRSKKNLRCRLREMLRRALKGLKALEALIQALPESLCHVFPRCSNFYSPQDGEVMGHGLRAHQRARRA
ncbi:hypothetical protein RUND412_000178 [Rhizina undulata]